MEGDLVCAVDLGSSMIKAALVDARGGIACLARVEAPPVTGVRGAFDAEATATAARAAIAEVVGRSGGAGAVCGVALSSQRASLVPVGRDDLPDGPALSWQGACCGPSAGRWYAQLGRGVIRRPVRIAEESRKTGSPISCLPGFLSGPAVAAPSDLVARFLHARPAYGSYPLGRERFRALLGAAAAAWIGAGRLPGWERAAAALGPPVVETIAPRSDRPELEAKHQRYLAAVAPTRALAAGPGISGSGGER